VVSRRRQAVSLPVPAGHVASLSFLNISPDRSTWFITGADTTANSNQQVATTWAFDSHSRQVRWTAEGPQGASANSVNASPDGRLVAVGYSQGAVDVLDTTTGRLVVRDASSASIAAGWMA